PTPLSVPVLDADASSIVSAPAPPSTLPTNLAPGLTISRSPLPPNSTASVPPLIVPAFATVPALASVAAAILTPYLPPEISAVLLLLVTVPPSARKTPLLALPVPWIVPALVTVSAPFVVP